MQTCRHFVKNPYFMRCYDVCICLHTSFSYVCIYFTMQTCGHKNIQYNYCNCYYVVKAILYS